MTEPLTITTDPRPDRQIALTIELGPERTEAALQRAAKQVAKRANIPGFRRGKAPYATVLRHFGRDALLNEILDDLGQEVYKEALDIAKIEPFAEAQLEDVKLEPPTFRLVVPLRPEVDLDDYRSVRLEAQEAEVTDADVDAILAEQRASRATWVEIDRPAEIGDTVTVDIHGSVGEDTIMDNHDWDVLLKEEAGWLPGFAEAFVGLEVGGEKGFTLRYPEDSSSRYKGQEATFQTTLKKVKSRLEPELNDEFAASLGDFASLDDLRAKTRERLLQQRTAEAQNKLDEAALEAVIAKAHMSYPPAAVEDTLNDMVDEVRRNLKRSGYSLEDFVRLQGLTLDKYREKLRGQAEKRLQGRLVLGELASVEKLDVAPDEIQAEIERTMPAGEGTEKLREAFETDFGRAVVRQDVLTDKALARLREIVTGRAPALPPETAETGEQPAAEAASPEPAAEAAQPTEQPAAEAASPEPAAEAAQPAEQPAAEAASPEPAAEAAQPAEQPATDAASPEPAAEAAQPAEQPATDAASPELAAEAAAEDDVATPEAGAAMPETSLVGEQAEEERSSPAGEE